jgi:stabilin-1
VDSAFCSTSQPEVNHVPIEGPLLEAPGCSLFGLSGVLTVGSSRCLHSHAEALRVRLEPQEGSRGCWLA